MFVKVAVENTNYSFDVPFTYQVPEELVQFAEVGKRVSVPFGRGNKTSIAMVLAICEEEENEKIKPIISFLDENVVLSKEMIELAFFMKSRYYCTLFDCIKLMLPAGISYKIKQVYILLDSGTQGLSDRQKKIIHLMSESKKNLSKEEIQTALDMGDISREINFLLANSHIKSQGITKRKTGDASEKIVVANKNFKGKLSPKQQEIYDTLLELGQLSLKELSYYTGISLAVIKALADKGGAEIFEQEVYRKPKNLKSGYDELQKSEIVLSKEQEEVFEKLKEDYENENLHTSLLYGVTGSGKTSVFLKLIDYVIERGKQVILMVPEIALTPQTIELFKTKYKDKTAIFHSALSVGERLDEWKRAQRGECDIVIGTRSAIFAPLKKLGLIVIDEEQEYTYKSEITPRYNAKDIAKFRSAYEKSFCLLCSATPSIESYYMAKNGKYSMHSLTKRYGVANLPKVKLIDMNEEEVFGNKTDISTGLKNALIENYESGKQSIILLNRRGYHTFARCGECHSVVTCPNCSISLTLHSANNRLMCHYCGHSVPIDLNCHECGSDKIVFSGYGTQRAEEALQGILPNANILRIDADSTSAKYSLEKKLDAFSSGEYDIMIGTQMVAKGLNFPNVTLVGVLSVDQSLCNDDFRSNEKTFDLLTQVVGRSGRGEHKGEAVIQTYMPENSYLRLASMQDYNAFYNMEISFRKAMLYPPFVDMLLIGLVGENEPKLRIASELFLKKLSQKAEEQTEKLPLRVLRPSPAAVAKIAGKYRYKIIIKNKNTKKFREIISELLIEFAKDREFSDVTVYADPNPYVVI
ncbi:MAG: primosomal protein N' [Clostridia bacterium]